ncbi:LigB subunit of an aromatic-ring-opening dioxygenase LigAB [Aureobasidium sp. EXF-8845]|nr:LigB subunit of an aromatic-ring-opening dioxygenase LigAB [Aureobasidium sp. EXF-8845]KAI4858044.1 LigB subunit of an aromatic-ring-opening dioxygenase LigAB [Aureobasidium sp. EXF-8846]
MQAPIVFVSHGSPLMCCKESTSSDWWSEVCGRQALERGIKGVVFIGAHWEELGDRIRVATKYNPDRVQMDLVPRSYWENYPINISSNLAERVIELLGEHQFGDVQADPSFDWHDDTITPARWMFPDGTPPTTVVSLNARYNPVFHVQIGRALSQLSREGIMIVGTGGAVHNLYRNNWVPMLRKGDNFQPGTVPARWATDFECSVSDVIKHNKGAKLAGALIRLTQNPKYRDAHPTDDHFYPLLVAGGAASCFDQAQGKLAAQTWELQHMCNDQFIWQQ